MKKSKAQPDVMQVDDSTLAYWANYTLGGSGPLSMMLVCKSMAIMIFTERGIDYRTVEYRMVNGKKPNRLISVYVNGKIIRTEPEPE